MWFRKKKELIKQIERYGKDAHMLLEFAESVGRECMEEVCLSDVQAFYRQIWATRTPFTAIAYMQALRKFFRHHRGQNVLKADLIKDNPLNSVDINVIIPPMQKYQKGKPGRPKDLKSIQKVKLLREEGKLSFREIARALNKDLRQVYVWYNYKVEKPVDTLSTAK